MCQRADLIFTGNATDQGHDPSTGGWFIGHFIAPEDGPDAALRHSRHVEVKWGTHERQSRRRAPVANAQATTLAILVHGRFELKFPASDRSVVLERQGDYVVFGPQVVHDWEALEDSVVITVRWPSLPGDQQAPGSAPAGV